MFKTISAAVLAVSVLAAPAMATTLIKSHHAPFEKHIVLKRSLANANAKMVSRKHYHHHHTHGHHHRHGSKKVIVRHY